MACGADPTPERSGTTSTPSALPDACTNETRSPPFKAELPFSDSSGVTVKLLSSTPAPPKVGDNTWVIEVDDPTGAPIKGAELGFSQFMPDHGHPGVKQPVITEEEGGRYSLSPVNFNMQGYWENYVTIASATVDVKVTVKVCALP